MSITTIYVNSSTLTGTVTCTNGSVVIFTPPDDDPTAGVREPRRPLPVAPAAGAALTPTQEVSA